MRIGAVLLILCLCAVVVGQRCYYHRRMKILRDAVNSSRQDGSHGAGNTRAESTGELRYHPQVNMGEAQAPDADYEVQLADGDEIDLQ